MNSVVKVSLAAKWLIKHLCIDTGEPFARMEIAATFRGAPIRYEITIKKVSTPHSNDPATTSAQAQ